MLADWFLRLLYRINNISRIMNMFSLLNTLIMCLWNSLRFSKSLLICSLLLLWKSILNFVSFNDKLSQSSFSWSLRLVVYARMMRYCWYWCWFLFFSVIYFLLMLFFILTLLVCGFFFFVFFIMRYIFIKRYFRINIQMKILLAVLRQSFRRRFSTQGKFLRNYLMTWLLWRWLRLFLHNLLLFHKCTDPILMLRVNHFLLLKKLLGKSRLITRLLVRHKWRF